MMKLLDKFERTIILRHNLQMMRSIHGLCLDVGSGANPLMAADVLCDLFPRNSKHRGGYSLLTYNKPFVQCDIHFLPFKDKAFDFVHCCHVLEHSEDPKKAYSELQRVGKSGYVETPSLLQENFLYGLIAHKWIISGKDNQLYFQTPRRRFSLPHTENVAQRSRSWSFTYRILNVFYRFLDENFHVFRNRFYF